MELSTIGVILFGCVALASILMLVVNAIDYDLAAGKPTSLDVG